MLCVECGKREAKYDNLCEVCFLKKVKFTYLPSYISITQCPHCGAIKFKGEWKRMSREDMLRELILRNVKFLHHYDSFTLEIEEEESRREATLHVIFNIRYKDLEVKEEHFSNVKINYESCTRCNRYFGNYFEAILQLRGMREGEEEIVKEFAYSRIEHYSQKNENLFLTKEERRKEGIDLYLSDKREAKKIAKEICEKYGATLKESPQIVGRKDGQDVYRVTYSVRLPEYREGDVVNVDEIPYLVEHVSRNMISLLSLKDGKRKRMDVRRHRVGRVVKKEDLEEAIVVYSEGMNIQLMDKDYRIIETKTPFFHRNGDKVRIVRIGGEVFILP